MTETAKPDIVLDAHSDILLDVLALRRRGEKSVLEERFLPGLRSAGINAVVCSLFIPDEYVPEGSLRMALDQIAALKRDLEESPSFRLCRGAGDCYSAAAGGRVALFLSLEGAEPVGRDILLLDIFYSLGVRLLGLAWSRRNYACDGISFEDAPPYAREGGLTPFGRELVRRAARLGMVVDVSHLNDAGFFEAARLIGGPFIASHSDCRALTPSPRNLTDEQLGILAGAGGVAGMNAYGPFCETKEHGRTAESLLAHLAHAVGNFGYEHAGIGFDLCDCVESLRGPCPEPKDIFAGHADAARFVEAVRARYPREQAAAILGGNFMRVFETAMR
ncbi:membrane dipeptidase [Cloacibacillus sp. An23]|uniref:dipeptidase n=1 Tax=Cloacibacillus sp. An23 TaxID=1965591 RepID=UPI000B3A5A8F|nr:membrane dipeptidase [Cloacibacillus sp. An23]OUO93992.1 hypothetical protein B5F39_04815 [Cloacibacillus sp. An23]